MKFNSIQDAFNHYKNEDIETIESRTQEIAEQLNKNDDVDVDALKNELEGMRQARLNREEKRMNTTQFNPVTQMEIRTEVPAQSESIYDTKEYRDAFYKKMLGQELTEVEERTFNNAMEQQHSEKRADAFNTTTNSAAVLPTLTLNEVVKRARTIGGLLNHVRRFAIPTNIAIPVGTPNDKAEWHKEGVEVQADKVNVAKVTFGAYEILKVFSMSVATKRMTIQAFESYLIDELATCVMETIADGLVNGTGTNQGTGLLNGITWDETNTLELTGDYTDFTGALAKLKRGYSARAKFAMSSATLYNNVYALVDGNKRPIFLNDPKNESVGHILGKEVIIDDNIEDGVIILGDFNYLAYNMPQGIMLEVSRESSFRSGLIDYRAMAIADTKPLLDEAFIKLEVAPTGA